MNTYNSNLLNYFFIMLFFIIPQISCNELLAIESDF